MLPFLRLVAPDRIELSAADYESAVLPLNYGALNSSSFGRFALRPSHRNGGTRAGILASVPLLALRYRAVEGVEAIR